MKKYPTYFFHTSGVRHWRVIHAKSAHGRVKLIEALCVRATMCVIVYYAAEGANNTTYTLTYTLTRLDQYGYVHMHTHTYTYMQA